MTRWEYIKKRRGWNTKMILDSLDDKSWESFSNFFEVRQIETPPRAEYDEVLDNQAKEVPKVSDKAATTVKTTTRKRRTRKNAGKRQQ